MLKTTGPQKVFSMVETPAYYVEGRRIKPLSGIEDWSFNFHLGNVMKSISRVDRKRDGLEDLKKAAYTLINSKAFEVPRTLKAGVYLAREIERRNGST